MAKKRGPRSATRSTRLSTAIASGAALGAVALAPHADAATFTVTNLNDSGVGSLRQAISDANATAGTDTITFQSGLTGTITLTTGQLDIYDSVDIQGPGPATLSVSGNNSSRVFYLYASSITIDVTISGLTITGGNDSIGGGVINFDEHLTLDNDVITANTASGDGAGVWADGFNMGLTITNSRITGNTAGGEGGGIYVEDTGAPLLIQNTVISGNQAAGSGGGIYFYDPDTTVTLDKVTIANNTAGALGGGVYMYDTDGGAVTITNSTISGNSALAGGGFFFYGPDDPVLMENTTISGNQATSGNGGGIYLYNAYGAGFTLRFVTISNNSAAGTGGGVFDNATPIQLESSIIANNTATGGKNDIGTPTDGSFDSAYSLIEDPVGATINDNGGTVTGVDPQLGPLANNGGPTQTHLPGGSSPVINAGDPAFVPPPATDQRGLSRVVGGRVDMGAVEVNGGALQFSTTAASVAENGGSITLTVTRTGGTDNAVSAAYASSNVSATAGSDYTAVNNTVNFANCDAVAKTFNVTILDDTLVEGNETFNVTLSAPSGGATLGANNPETVTITDFEPGQVTLSQPAYTVAENGASLLVTVNRVNGSNGPISVQFATSNGSATAGSDYTANSGILNWADGDTAPKTFSIPILDDALVEGNETINITLSNPTGGAALGANPAAVATITDVEPGTLHFAVSTANVAENGGSVTLTVTRTGGATGTVTVQFATANGTALAGSDFTTSNSTLTWTAGDAAPKTIAVPILDDGTPEPTESFSITLSNPTGGATVSAPSTATVTIQDNDVEIPALDSTGKIVLAALAAIAGLFVISRNRLFGFFVTLFLLAALVPGSAHAQWKPHAHTAALKHEQKKEAKAGKTRGVISSVSTAEGKLTITFVGGASVAAQTATVNVVNVRTHGQGRLQDLRAGQTVVIRQITNKKGVTRTHIRIVG